MSDEDTVKQVAATLRGAICTHCGTTDDVIWQADPFSEEIHDDSTPMWLCGDCAHESAMDI